MIRQSPSRNQRSKGIKVKHILQICLLVAVCFWLIYQVKHSHDKKKEFDANDRKISVNARGGDEVIKLGRKDLHPQLEETDKEIEKHDVEEAEDETGGEEEENKHEEEEQEEDKAEEEKDEGRGGGDDEIDEHEQEKSDHEEDFIDEEKDSEEGNGKENEEKDGQTENENSLEEHDHDGVARNTHEAREEQYKADDASSAVTHDTRSLGSENENGTIENSNESAEVDILEHENKVNNTEEISAGQNTAELRVENGETVENGASLNATVKEMGSYIDLSNSTLNTAILIQSNDQLEQSNNSADVSNASSLQNGTVITSDSTGAQHNSEGGTTSGENSNLQSIFLDQASNSSISSDGNQSGSNLTISVATQNKEEIAGGSSNSSNILDIVDSQNIVRSNESSVEEDSSGSSDTVVNTDGSQNENSDTNNEMEGTYESSGSSETENTNEVQHDPIDSSDSSFPLEEKEVRTDVDTLPEIKTEGSNSEDAAAE